MSGLPQDQERAVVAAEISEANGIAGDQAGGDTCGVVAIFEKDDFWRWAERAGQDQEIIVCSNDGEAVLGGIVRDLLIRRAGAETNLGNVD